jgi:ATP-binding cassette subfamily B protein/subfamily B ATP-binding cassette protein MsbA
VKKWSRVLLYFRPELPRIFAALLLMLLGIGANLLKPWPVALIIDYIAGGKAPPVWLPKQWHAVERASLLGFSVLLIFVLHAAQGVFAAGQNYLSIKAGLSGLARIRTQLFGWMQRLSLAFYQRRSQGDLIYRATWDTYSLQTVFQQGLFKFLNSFVTLVLMLIVMWRVNAVLALITLILFPPLLGTMYLFGRKMNERSLAAHQADSRVTSLVQQNISALPLIQSYAREAAETAVFAEQVKTSFEKRLRQHGAELTYWLVIAVLFGLATAGLAWWGGREILANRLTVGELVIFLSYLGQLYDPLNQLSQVGATISDANAGLHRIFEILDAQEEIPETANPLSFPKKNERPVQFEQVTFGYLPTKPVLKGISFRIEEGEAIGLVGPSGSGKTTLLNLLPRFYEPDRGAITIGGRTIGEFALRELREQIAYVFQESFLLPGTVAENIGYAKPSASRGDIERAARLANAHEFITHLPHGYDTIVGEAAARLSVGEKQRINIARAFLKDAPILLLDEPTSALDAETEAAVIDSLARLIANRTTIMAAHRLSTMRYAHRIVVLEQGLISEFGTPEELLRRQGGYYARAVGLSSEPFSI